MVDSLWLTVITVVKDDPVGFARTSASLRNQDLDGVEWVVIDSSTERLCVDDAVTVWTPPRGIYAAMNEGLETATGEYVYFLNAGDTLEPGVISTIRLTSLASRPAWLYGDVRFSAANGTSVTPPPFDYAKEKARNFAAGRFPPHQGTIVKRDVLRRLDGFDESYRVAADYKVMLQLSELAEPAILDFTVAEFAVGGTSTERWLESFVEFHRARSQVLRLHGLSAARESWNTMFQIATVALTRMLRRA